MDPSSNPTNAPIDQLPTCIWWIIAHHLSIEDLARLRLLSRQIAHELHIPYLDRKFESITIDATAPQPTHPIWVRQKQDVCLAVRSLTLQGHLDFTGGNGKHFAFKLATPDKHYAPLASIASFTNLQRLDIAMVTAEWFARDFPINNLSTILATNGIKIRDLRLTRVDLSVNELAQFLDAFNGSIKELSLHLDQCAMGEGLELIRVLAAMQLQKLDLQHFGRWSLSLPRCNKLFPKNRHAKQGSYVMREDIFSAHGQGAVGAGLNRIVEWWEAGNLRKRYGRGL
ncbi:hypothetical protein LTR56_004773 [Elasticomyces elasticus]|nr:hypothetical protein LTR56_004773 [Elasticomyces elasticus]KAK3665629.1 hypothetical protein LTR22_003569 [Elasticomyces elasticus]KAK4930333.1 hypothetical protein LTR49_003074 [Elasticomyces elasticus]KAK5768940.1 hypothetical protein LTS12_001000 [Elasticomyces elasticus]